jgi:putative transposase
MATRNKIFIPNNTCFITFTILGWKAIFTSDKYCNLIYKWFDYIKKNYDNKIYAYVIMPTHIHCLLYISDKSKELSKLIQNAKRFLAYQIVGLLKEDNRTELLNFFQSQASIKKGAKHKIFKDSFDSKAVFDVKFFIEKLNYIHNNPCAKKWSLAEAPQDYKHSSAANYFGGIGMYEVEVVRLY